MRCRSERPWKIVCVVDLSVMLSSQCECRVDMLLPGIYEVDFCILDLPRRPKDMQTLSLYDVRTQRTSHL